MTLVEGQKMQEFLKALLLLLAADVTLLLVVVVFDVFLSFSWQVLVFHSMTFQKVFVFGQLLVREESRS